MNIDSHRADSRAAGVPDVPRRSARIGFALLASPSQAGIDRARRIAEDSKKYIQKREGIEVCCPDDPVVTLDDAARAASLFRRSEVDAIVVQHGTVSPVRLSIELVRDLGLPLATWGIPEPPLDGSPHGCGSMTSLLAHASALRALGRRFTYVYGLPDSEECRRDIDRFIRAVGVRKALRKSKIALIGYVAPGAMQTFDEVAIKGVFGVEVEHIDLSEILQQIAALTVDEIESDVHDVHSGDYRVEVANQQALRRSCAAHAAIRKILERGGFAAAAPKCWPEMLERHSLGICAAVSRLTDSGIITSCAGDVDGALSMLVQHLYTTRPPFLGDWLQRDEKSNQVFFWHCGSAPASLVNPRCDARLIDAPRGEGNVAFDFPLKTGDVTVARLLSCAGGFKMLVLRGKAVESAQSMQGTYVSVRFETPVRRLLDTILVHGFPQHYSIIYDDIKDDLLEFAGQCGIEAVAPEPGEP